MIEIDHRDWERLGAGSAGRQEANRHRWETLLPHFIEAANEGDQ